jgi:hypothetical protein
MNFNNREWEMDYGMYKILQDALWFGEKVTYLNCWDEGIKYGRIWEVKSKGAVYG